MKAEFVNENIFKPKKLSSKDYEKWEESKREFARMIYSIDVFQEIKIMARGRDTYDNLHSIFNQNETLISSNFMQNVSVKDTAKEILSQNGLIIENIQNILKPKENAAELKQYCTDVLQVMIDLRYPRMINDVETAFNNYQFKYMEYALNNNIAPKEAAHKILDNILADGVENFKY